MAAAGAVPAGDAELVAKLKAQREWHTATIFDHEGAVIATTCQPDEQELKVPSVDAAVS